MMNLKNLWLSAKERMSRSVKKINTIYNAENKYLLMEDGNGFHAFRHAIVEVFSPADPYNAENKARTEELLKKAHEPFLDVPLSSAKTPKAFVKLLLQGSKKCFSLLFFALKGQNRLELAHNILALFTEFPLRIIDYTAQTGYLLSLKKIKKILKDSDRHPSSYIILPLLLLTTFIGFSIHIVAKVASLITRACISPDKSFNRMAAIDPALGYLSLVVSVVGQAVIGAFTFGAAWAVMPAIAHPLLFVVKAVSASPIGFISHTVSHGIAHGMVSRTESTAGFLIGSVIGFVRNAFVFYKNKVLPPEEAKLDPTLKQSNNDGMNRTRSSYGHIMESAFYSVRNKNTPKKYIANINKFISDDNAVKVYDYLKRNLHNHFLPATLRNNFELLPDEDYITTQDLKDFMAFCVEEYEETYIDQLFLTIQSKITDQPLPTDKLAPIPKEEGAPVILGYNQSLFSYESNCV